MESVSEEWILLDSQSMVHVFCNRKLLHKIRRFKIPCRISCNAEMVTTDLIGDLDGYDNAVWYVPGGIAIILSLHRVGQVGQDGGVFRVTKPESP